MQKVAVIIPCFNEVKFIEPLIKNISNQKLNGLDLEIIIVDGMSNDGTKELLDNISKNQETIRVLENPKQIVPCALNIAIKNTNADIIVRMDCHTLYEDEYIYQCVRELNRTNACCVGGAWVPKAKGFLSKSISAAFLSPIGSGAARSRNPDFDGEVDTVYLGCWMRKKLISIGMFDETLVRNQDDELCLRIIKNGGTIFQSSKIKSYYYVRESLRKLFKQFYQYGFWKPAVIKKHRKIAAIRHLIPGIFVATNLLIIISSIILKEFFILYFFLSYFLFVSTLSIFSNRKTFSFKERFASSICVVIMHYSYGFGTIFGLIKLVTASPNIDISISR